MNINIIPILLALLIGFFVGKMVEKFTFIKAVYDACKRSPSVRLAWELFQKEVRTLREGK